MGDQNEKILTTDKNEPDIVSDLQNLSEVTEGTYSIHDFSFHKMRDVYGLAVIPGTPFASARVFSEDHPINNGDFIVLQKDILTRTANMVFDVEDQGLGGVYNVTIVSCDNPIGVGHKIYGLDGVVDLSRHNE